jgi:transposase
MEFLKDFRGFLQTDGYAGYNKSGGKESITHVGCFAHARRYFHEAYTLNKKSATAHRGLTYIQNIYKIENDLRELKLSDEEFVEKRKNAVAPVLDDFYNWLVSQQNAVLPESRAGKAVSYALAEWSKLIKFLDHHLLTPDNNAVENAIRPFVLGRKNWLFSNTPRGAGSSAVIFSVIESAKANGLDPYKYLKFLFENLPGKKSREDLKILLPNYVSIEELR